VKTARTGLDPRTKIVVLVTVIIVVFSFPGNLVMGITVAGCILLFLIDGLVLQLVGFAAVYLFLTAIQLLLLPRVGATAAMMLAGFVYFKVLMPIALPADHLMRTTSVQEVLAAAKKMRVPEKMRIGFAIIMRYLPVVGQNFRQVRDAMKLRDLRGLGTRVEAVYVPMLMNTVQAAEDLSTAACTRGIENPGDKTSFVKVGLRTRDFLVITSCLALITAGVLK
jgi:hypothetical protein